MDTKKVKAGEYLYLRSHLPTRIRRNFYGKWFIEIEERKGEFPLLLRGFATKTAAVRWLDLNPPRNYALPAKATETKDEQDD